MQRRFSNTSRALLLRAGLTCALFAVPGGQVIEAGGSPMNEHWMEPCIGCTTGPVSYCGEESANSVGDGARLDSISGFGTPVAEFVISNLPSNQFGILYAGAQSATLAFGCGTRCIGGVISRGDVVLSDGAGFASSTFDMTGLDHVQFWYRDPANTGCESGFNLSNALGD